MFCFGDGCMYWFIGVNVKNSVDIMVEATAVNAIELTYLESYHSKIGDIFFDRDGCWARCKFWAFLY